MKYKIILIFSVLLFLSFPTSIMIYRWAVTPPDRVFAGTFGFSDDYNVYTSIITQGIRGRWTVINKFTSLPHPGAFVHEEYLLLGKFLHLPVALLFRLLRFPAYIPQAPFIFHLSRLILEILILWSIWQFIKTIIPETSHPSIRIASWLLTLFSGVLPQLIMERIPSQFSWIAGTPYFREMNVIYRFNPLPQAQTAIIAMVLLLTLYLKFHQNNRLSSRMLISALILSSVASWTDIVSALTASTVIGVFFLFRLATGQNLKKLVPSVLFLIVIIASMIPAALYFSQLRTQPAWIGIARYLPDQNLFSLNSFFLLFPLTLPLTIFFIVRYLRSINKNQKTLPLNSFFLLLSWVIAFFLLIILSDVIQINRLRLLRPPVLVPLSIFTAYAIFEISQFVTKKWQPILLAIITACVIIPSILTAQLALSDEYRMLSSFTSIVYPTINQALAYQWLFNHTPENTAVAALYEAASLIPSFSGNATLAGNVTEDPTDYAVKSTALTTFFSGSTNQTEAKEFLVRNNVSYVYWGPQERSLRANISQYPFLRPVYSNPQVTIFQVK